MPFAKRRAGISHARADLPHVQDRRPDQPRLHPGAENTTSAEEDPDARGMVTVGGD